MFDWLRGDAAQQSKFGRANSVFLDLGETQVQKAAPAKRAQKATAFKHSDKGPESIWRSQSKNFKNSKISGSKDSTDSRPVFRWADMVARIGEEIGGSLNTALENLQQPITAQGLSQAIESIEQAKRAAMLAQKFAHLRAGAGSQQAELLELREVVKEVLEQRRAWMIKNGVKVRTGLVAASVYADASALFSLIDELVNWAGSMSGEVGFTIEEEPHSHRIRLNAFSRIDPSTIPAGSWENAGWFLWHQLARTLGAKAELRVLPNALSVCVTFPVPPPIEQRMNSSELALDNEISHIVKGCRVVVIASDEALREEAFRALNNMQLDLKTTWSVQAAMDALGNSVPNAVVYDGRMDAGKIMQMRNDFAPRGKVAFIELSQTEEEEFSVTELGNMSTAHVSVANLSQSLGPALLFELCKVM